MIHTEWAAHVWLAKWWVANPRCRARKAIRQSRIRDMKIWGKLGSFCDAINVKGIQSIRCILFYSLAPKAFDLFRYSFCRFGLVWRMWGTKRQSEAQRHWETCQSCASISCDMSRRALRDPHCVRQPCCRLHCSALDDSARGLGFCSSPASPAKSYKIGLMFWS